ncbi:hypothetical protein Tco_0489025 [Tanacetum coccineum]
MQESWPSGSVQGHYKKDCPKLRNKNQGNQAGNGNSIARDYAMGTAGTNPNSNVVTGTFLLNNHYALILFDTGADRSYDLEVLFWPSMLPGLEIDRYAVSSNVGYDVLGIS